ncbi:hypothetical protein FB1_09140 [Flavobacterium branchiophilum NBRC 15030 = ATCC 35035]|nr:hypothetical protein FB1_09140 [Flavobacterium branchiophilum NBRC 15030 = ATCC 35035]
MILTYNIINITQLNFININKFKINTIETINKKHRFIIILFFCSLVDAIPNIF